jgi:hypothetical protein
MGSFGNLVVAALSPSDEYDNSSITGTDSPLLGPACRTSGGALVNLPLVSTPPTDPGRYTPKSNLLGEVPGLTSDHSTFEQVEQDLHGPGSLNWEKWRFTEMRTEMEALQPGKLRLLANAWTDHGNTLKTASGDFKNSVRKMISENWSGASADAADAATQQVTKTSILDFTPSSDALSHRLTALADAFTHIQQYFPPDANAQLIDSGNFDKQQLDHAINAFNSEYRLVGGHLRNSSNGYVAPSTAVDQMNQLNRSISDYQLAVQLFRDTYNPTVAAVTNNFPNLPSPPSMTFGQPGTGPGLGGAPGIGGGGVPGLGAGGGGPGIGAGGGFAPISPPGMPSNAQLTALTSPNTAQSPITGSSSGFPSAWSASPFGASATPTSPPFPSAASATPSAASGSGLSNVAQQLAGGPMEGLSSLPQSLGQAMNAGRGAGNPGALAGASNPGNLPKEGALALGKGPLGGSGGANGPGMPGSSITKPGSAPAIAAGAGADRTAAAGYRAGLSGAPGSAGAGMPGAGAPAAGHQGANAQGAPHQPSKMLRRKKNGEELIGDTEAVVPVLGATAPKEEDAKPDATVDAQRDWAFAAPRQRAKKTLNPMQSSP